ncbi:hypothetical protein WJX84_010645 [Apatococcus fuscideae]|uniref:NPL4-like protein 1 n=1 Tax=Apatococcus fuscideae TaxID=2026836 RepID=A0AAW1SVE8_9CHLO
MILRLRSRDGLERVTVKDSAQAQDLYHKVMEEMNIPEEGLVLSKQQQLLTSKESEKFQDLRNGRQTLSSLGVKNGDMVFMHYPFERQVEAAIKANPFATRTFGQKMTVEQMMARQTRIERQDKPHCELVSFERHGANAFQQYVHGALAFSIKRGALLYGRRAKDQTYVDAIYEPPQQGGADWLQMDRGGEEEKRADFIAKHLGLEKVGWIFTQSNQERDFILSTPEVCQMAAMQDELGPECVTGVVSVTVTDGNSDVQFEAFQVSDQCVQLYKDGWFEDSPEPKGVSRLHNPNEPRVEKPIIVAGKDEAEVDNDFFLIPVKIADHEGPLTSDFSIENRLLPQGKPELRQYLQKNSSKPYTQRLSDFHILLYLAKQLNLDLTDMRTIVEHVKANEPVPEGYTLMIDTIAEV